MVGSRSIKKLSLLCFTFSALATPLQSNAGLWDTFSNWYVSCFKKNSTVTGVCTIIAGALFGFGLGKAIVYLRSQWQKKPNLDAHIKKTQPALPTATQQTPNATTPHPLTDTVDNDLAASRDDLSDPFRGTVSGNENLASSTTLKPLSGDNDLPANPEPNIEIVD